LSSFLKTAIQAAKAAGKIHRQNYGKVRNIRFKSGNKLNLVTEVDGRCEKVILGILKKRFPTHNFWGEESGRGNVPSEYTWLIDPLDGTTNYAHAYPFFCVSIALTRNRLLHSPLPLWERDRVRGGSFEVVAAVVYDALRDECFTAEKGQGASLNGKRLRVTQTSDLKQSLVCTGFAYQVMKTNYNFDNFRNFVRASQGVRRDGSAAMNLAYVAAGRFDGFWERGIQAWDMAAGILLVKEAGGKVTDLTGKPFDLMAQNALASNGRIHEKMFRILKNGKDEKAWKDLFSKR
jgi:myo-inositol-1(or 4)-monophosphatase